MLQHIMQFQPTIVENFSESLECKSYTTKNIKNWKPNYSSCVCAIYFSKMAYFTIKIHLNSMNISILIHPITRSSNRNLQVVKTILLHFQTFLLKMLKKTDFQCTTIPCWPLDYLMAERFLTLVLRSETLQFIYFPKQSKDFLT